MAVTANITRIKLMGRVSALVGIGAAALLLWLAVPYGAASFILLPAEPVVEKLGGEVLTEAFPLDPALERYSLAQKIYPHSDGAEGYARLKLAEAVSANNDPAKWQAAEDALKASLAARPLDAMVYGRLAYIAMRTNRPDEATRLLLASAQYGRYMPGFMQWRLIIALSLWSRFTDTEQTIWADQIGLLWRQDKRSLLRLARIPALGITLDKVMQQYYADDYKEFSKKRGRISFSVKTP